jgi:hypothetical protein
MQDVCSTNVAKMQPALKKRAHGSVTSRSRVTNGRWILEGIDNRLPMARRFRDLCKAFAAEAGGTLTESEKGLIRQAAAISIQAEALQASIVSGKDVSADEVIRLSGEARRTLQPIMAKAEQRKSAEPVADLAAYLATKAAGGAA